MAQGAHTGSVPRYSAHSDHLPSSRRAIRELGESLSGWSSQQDVQDAKTSQHSPLREIPQKSHSMSWHKPDTVPTRRGTWNWGVESSEARGPLLSITSETSQQDPWSSHPSIVLSGTHAQKSLSSSNPDPLASSNVSLDTGYLGEHSPRRPSTVSPHDASWSGHWPWQRSPSNSIQGTGRESQVPSDASLYRLGANASPSHLSARHSVSLLGRAPTSLPRDNVAISRGPRDHHEFFAPRHSAPQTLTDGQAAEACRRVDSRSLWLDAPTSPQRGSLQANPEHIRSPSSPRTLALVNRSIRRPSVSSLSSTPNRGSSDHTDVINDMQRSASGSNLLSNNVWKSEPTVPTMHWPPSKANASTAQTTRRAGSLAAPKQDQRAYNPSFSRSTSAEIRPGSLDHVTSSPSRSPLPETSVCDQDLSRDLSQVSITAKTPKVSENSAESEMNASESTPSFSNLNGFAPSFTPTPYMPIWAAVPPSYFALPTPARAFVIKSFTKADVETSLHHAVWTSTEKGNHRLNQAWLESSHLGPIYLFFSVNGSGRFCGIAQMTSGLDYSQTTTIWAEQHRWKGLFRVHWLLVKDIPNAHLRGILLQLRGEVKSVTQSRDTQELPMNVCHELLRIFYAHNGYSSLQPIYPMPDSSLNYQKDPQN
ncbi:hypothetical protein MPSI1_003989 [Malassezia psittaci]|uniref:YTH domain-containing protein n=1 Tax=Malassezia psittaci TaxID=1821823 RepID=A0AAF0FIU3_9BASI|nr:hypothetical protein MPSI1_003989 [Malassezia psittaci]